MIEKVVLKPCPFCGKPLTPVANGVFKCLTKTCFLLGTGVDVDWPERVEAWNTRVAS